MRALMLVLAALAGCTAFDRVRVTDDEAPPAWAAPPAAGRYERLPLPADDRAGRA